MGSATDVTVNIRGIAYGGAGVGEVTNQVDGRSDLLGITAFVPFTAPGEIVTARVVQRKERYINGELLVVETKAESRTTPLCKLFGQCGGCELQHLKYTAQLATKHQMISSALRAAQFSIHDIEKLQQIIPSSEYGYRRRISLHIDQSGKVGFYRSSSRSVVPTDHCPVAHPAINELLKNAQGFGLEVMGKLSGLQLEADDTGVVAVLRSPYALSKQAARAIMESAKRFFPNALLIAGDQELEGYGRQILEIPLNERKSLSLRVPAGFFSQVNASINTKLISRSIELTSPKLNERVLDLYSGAGNFSLPFAKAGALVSAVECDSRLVALGRENALHYGLKKQLEFSELSVEKFLKFQAKEPPPSILLADPPRSGLGSLIPQLPKAQSFVLVSCHLPSFVRDAKALIEQGYTLQTIEPYDMFAQTTYVEILALFTLR
jgi:23S rRNA (uracil1939-C5)-methyltransferase